MGHTDDPGVPGEAARHEPLPPAFGDPDGVDDVGPEGRLPGDDDPRARRRPSSRPVMPDDWVGEHDHDPVPDSVLDAGANRTSRGPGMIESGGGTGG